MDRVDGHLAPHPVAAGYLGRQAGQGHDGVHGVGPGLAPEEGVHAAHGRAHHQPEALDPEPLGDQGALGDDHVGVVVVGEFGVQPVRGLGRFAVPDAVGEDDEVAVGVQQAAGGEQHVGELGLEELAARSSRAMQDQHGVGDVALRVLAAGPGSGN